MQDPLEKILEFGSDLKVFSTELFRFVIRALHFQFIKFEEQKGFFVTSLYRQRGKMAGRLVHSGMAALAALGIAIAPVIAQEFPGRSVDPWSVGSPSSVLSASTTNDNTTTQIAHPELRAKVLEYTVVEGDTVSTIAQKFGVSEDTIRWQNSLASKDSIKVDQTLEILPITGVSHKVQKGDTVYSIAKKYDSETQAIVDFPFNTFSNDETFELAVGQTVVVPDGIKQTEVLWSPIARVRQLTPDAGTVTATGSFVWPASGVISQGFAWYHPGLDIANRASPNVLAADSGTVIVSGWVDGSGYGNRVIINHHNGYTTLYGHLQTAFVVAGQSVRRGDVIGKMGSTGRSTGIHLHFEIRQSNGSNLNPRSFLR